LGYFETIGRISEIGKKEVEKFKLYYKHSRPEFKEK
jgi:hypothetical protein